MTTVEVPPLPCPVVRNSAKEGVVRRTNPQRVSSGFETLYRLQNAPE